jgi:hypothetical protein
MVRSATTVSFLSIFSLHLLSNNDRRWRCRTCIPRLPH